MRFFRKTPVKLPPKKFGFIETIPEPTDFVLGSAEQARKIELSRERNYEDSLPVKEVQERGFETYSCVSFSADNNIEILHKRQYGVEQNYSDRYTASMSDTVPGSGNTFKKVADSIRKNGMVLEEEYPWGGTNNVEYLQKPPQSVKDKAKAWLQAFEIQYEWVDWAGCDPNEIYQALLYGPVQVSVDANATYTREISKNTNHAVTVYKGVNKKSFSIFDHYDREKYDLPWNFYFGSAMQYSLLKKKYLPLVMVYGRPEIYAVVGSTACHVANESTWHYGEQIGIWEKKIQLITQNSFNEAYTKGEAITFN